MNHSASNLLNNSTNQQINISTIYWKVGILIAVSVFAYYPVILSLTRTWSGRNDYSHGFFVLPISLYFVWHGREKLKHIPIQPCILGGIIPTIIGSLMLLLGRISSVNTVQQISTIIILPGLVLMILGTRYLRSLSLPLFYLCFMIPPIIDLSISKIHWPFQLFSAALAAKLLEFIKIPVFHHAQFLELPNITLEVANACSGVRYLISIIAIGIPLAFFTQKTCRRKVLLIVLAVIVGILANPMRVTLVGIWIYYSGKATHGPFHLFQGLFVSGVGFIFLFIAAWLLNKIPSSKITQTSQNAIVSNDTPYLSLRGTKSRSNHIGLGQAYDDTLYRHNYKLTSEFMLNLKQFNRAWLTAVSFILALGGFLYFYCPLPIPLKSPLNEFPLTIGEWKGENNSDCIKPFSIQGADFEIARVYRNASGREIKLQIAYFESQQQDRELIHYTLQKLYDNNEEIAIQKDAYSSIRVNKSLLQDGSQNSLILYWYDLNGRIIADKYKAKFITAIDGLIHKRTNGAIIIVSTKLPQHDEMQKVLDDEIDFIQNLTPALKNHLPSLTWSKLFNE
jgi:EpsI family protein